jgi:hypothetical protein
VRDLQNDELLDCDLQDVRILFDDGRTITTPAAGEVVSGASSTVVGAEDMDRISVANLGPGQGVVAFIENDAREVTYWGPAEATSILKEQQAKAGVQTDS